jgi:hypothetical protein
MSRERSVLAHAGLLLCLTAAALHCDGRSERGGGPANLLLITLDTVRADRLGCYGYGRGTTPVLDGLAARGTLFERASAASAVTPVSHIDPHGPLPYRNRLRRCTGAPAMRCPRSSRRWPSCSPPAASPRPGS